MMRRILLATLMAVLLSYGSSVRAAGPATDDMAGVMPSANTAEEAVSPDIEMPAQESVAEQTPVLLPQMPGVGVGDQLASFGPSSGTVVGNRSAELRDEVLRLRSSVALNAGEFSILRSNGAAGAVQYHSTVAAITARLQNGTTRGNPILLRQWDEADASLNEVTNSMNRLNALQTAVAADSSLASYLLESVQSAFQLSGAVDEDHDQLKILRDEVSRMVVQLDYLRNQIASDIQRQTAYLTTERANLQALAFSITRGELLGGSAANHPVVINPPPVMMMPAPGQAMTSNSPFVNQAPAPLAAPMGNVTSGKIGPVSSAAPSAQDPVLPTGDSAIAPTAGRLLVLIRYNQKNVNYEQQLAQAVNMALQHKSDAQFSVIGVTPGSGEPNEIAVERESIGREAEAVKRSMVQLGIAPSRISMGGSQSKDARAPEVHVYVR